MDIVKVIDDTIEVCKETVNKGIKIWNSFDDNKKRFYIKCAAVAAFALVVIGFAYKLGTAHGKRIAFEEEDF